MRRFAFTRFHGLVLGFVLAGFAFALYLRGEPRRALARREAAWHARIEPGDIIFQDLECGLSCDLLGKVTHSNYSHVGIVLEENGHRVVWEALGPVAPVPLLDFVERGRGGLLGVYRLEPALQPRIPEIAATVRAFRGAQPDIHFQWDDSSLYSSELVEKAVQRATGVELAPPHPLGEGAFGKYAGAIKRFTEGALTEKTPVTTPQDLARSTHLRRIVDELRSAAR